MTTIGVRLGYYDEWSEMIDERAGSTDGCDDTDVMQVVTRLSY